MGCCKGKYSDSIGSHQISNRGKYAQTRDPPLHASCEETLVDTEMLQDVGPVGILNGNGTYGHHQNGSNCRPQDKSLGTSRQSSKSGTIGEYDEASADLVMQKVPSGESFHTCISRESKLFHIVQVAESIVTKRTDQKASLTMQPRQPSPTPTPPGIPASLEAMREEDPQRIISTASPSVSCQSQMTTIASSLSGRGSSDFRAGLLIDKNGLISSEVLKGASQQAKQRQRKLQVTSCPPVCSEMLDGTLRNPCTEQSPEPLSPRLDVGLPQTMGKKNTADLEAPSKATASRSVGFRKSFLGGRSTTKRQSKSVDAVTSAANRTSRRPSLALRRGGNPNMPADYAWLKELLQMICENKTSNVGSLDRSSPHAQTTTPLFAVAGSCPSRLAPMQAVMYSAVSSSSSVEFWWVKPVKGRPDNFERMMLDLWRKGPNKNDPGGSKAVYKPLGDLFSGLQGKVKQDVNFGVETVAGTQRAFIEDPRSSPPSKYYLYLVWQEEWSSPSPFATPYIKGKLAYQREPHRGLQAVIYLREYCIWNGRMSLADVETPIEPNQGVLPGNSLKEIGALAKVK